MTRRRLAGAYASSLISIALVLVLVAITSWLAINAGRVSDYFKESLQMSVILRSDASDAAAESLGTELSKLPFVREARVVTRAEGTEDLRKMLGDDFLSVFESSPVPVSVDVTLQAAYVSPDSLELVKSRICEFPVVEEVSCQQSLVEALNVNLARISIVLGIFILLMLFVSYVLIGNTVRISIFARRFTVHTMKLVGATRSFIRRPFMRSSFIQGLAASFMAIAAFVGGVFYVRRSFPQFADLCDLRSMLVVAGVVLATGIAVCAISTFFTVNKLVTMGKDELYY